MIKTRTLATDAGDRADFKYYALSGGGNIMLPPSALYLEYKDEYVSKYEDGMSKANTIISGVKPVGTQTFESSTRKRPYFNSCCNVKLHGFNYPYLYLSKDVYNPTKAAWYAPYWRKMAPTTDFNILPQGIPSWAATESAQRRAYWSMQPRFEGEVQMLNFIYELKDFKELMYLCGKTPYGYATACTRLGKQMKRIEKSYSTLKVTAGSVAGASKVWANLRLANQFALKPLIKDVAAITNQLVNTAEVAQAEFVKRGLESQVTHYSEPLSESYSGSWGTYNNAMWFTGLYQKTLFTATMEYTYQTQLRSGLELFKRYWGLEGTYGVLWEAIPFSFLADYFIKIGNSIHYMDKDPNVNINIMQYCESLLQQAAYCVGYNPGQALVLRFYCPSSHRKDGSLGFQPVAGVEYTWYNRIITTPNKGAALPRLTCPSYGQALNMLALVRGMI